MTKESSQVHGKEISKTPRPMIMVLKQFLVPS